MTPPAAAGAERILASLLRLVAIGFLLLVGTGVALLVLILLKPPGEPSLDEERDAVLRIEVALASPRPRVEPALELRLERADVAAMGLPTGTVRGRWGNFRLHTRHHVTDDLDYEHCLSNAGVIVDTATGATEHVVPAGTCLSTQAPLRLGD